MNPAAQQLPKHHQASRYLQQGLFDGIERFVELEKRIANLPTPHERGNAFEVFVEAYLSTQPLYQAKTIWPFSALTLAIKDRFSLGKNDMGVDGVLETHLGEFHAYQAKFKTGRASLNWAELSTFMGLTDRIAQRVVITNSEEISPVVSDRRGFYAIRGTDLDRLRADDFKEIRQWLAGVVVEHKRKTPLPCQQDALDAIVRTLKGQDRVTVLMPCGSGKTLVALWAAEQLGVEKILVLVPSLGLISQTVHEWLRETRWDDLSFLCVCSDPTVINRDEDALVLQQAEADFPVTTEPEIVRTFLERRTKGVKVVFSTYQSTPVVALGMSDGMRFDFGIFDEAHKTAGREGSRFGFALKNDNLSMSKRLFMTATPRHYDVRKRDKEGDAKLIYSMDAQEIYGPVAYKLSFSHAVREKMICGYKVLISVVTSTMVNDERIRRSAVKVEHEEVDSRQVVNQLAIKDAFERYRIEKAITFHKSVSAAASFTAYGPEGIEAHMSPLEAFHINGNMASGTRNAIMRAFANGKRTLISNARCLTEGIDVPAVDMVAFLTPKRSLVDIVQATGRAMRKNDTAHKTVGYVLVPIFLEFLDGESIEEAVSRAEFVEVWTVLQALQEHDEVLAEIIRQLREDRGKRKGFNDRRLREKIEVLGPTLALDTLRHSIETRIVDKVGSTWDERFGALVAFREQHGHFAVSEDPVLSAWMSDQRRLQKRDLLDKERKLRLDSIGFNWEQRKTIWDYGFFALSSYKQQHGSCDVPWNCHLPVRAHRSLQAWIWEQRADRLLNRLSDERKVRLESLGFNWFEMHMIGNQHSLNFPRSLANMDIAASQLKSMAAMNPPSHWRSGFRYSVSHINGEYWKLKSRGNSKCFRTFGMTPSRH